MTNIVRILLFVPPFLFLTSVQAQFQGKVERLADEITYQISVISSIDWSPPLSITNNAQITLRAPLGSVSVENLQSTTGNWDLITQIDGPDEAPDYSYFSFGLIAPMTDAEYNSTQALVLFSFQYSGDCAPLELFDNENDPFAPPNNLMINIGNVFTVLGAGPGVNAYEDNSEFDEIECETFPELNWTVTAELPTLPCFGNISDVFIKIIGGVEPYQIYFENMGTGETGDIEITDYQGDINLEGFVGGDYEFSLTDAIGNTSQMQMEIIEPNPIDFELDLESASCLGSEDGSAKIINLNGGTIASDYQILWATNGLNDTDFEENLNPGNFSVTVTDDNNCQIIEDFEIVGDAILEVDQMIQHAKCFDENSGGFELTGFGTNLPFSFEWNTDNQNGIGEIAESLGAGTYYFTATDATGVCQHIDSLEIEQAEKLEILYDIENTSCDGTSPSNVLIESVANAIFPVLISTDGATFQNTMEISAPSGDYLSLFIKDANGCEIIEEIYIPENEPITLELEGQIFLNLGDSIQLKTITNRDDLQFEWLPSTYLSCNDCASPIAKPLENITYRVVAQDTIGCRGEAKVSLLVDKNREVFFPNAISPNDDGVNDIFMVYAKANVQQIKSMRIANRWGAIIFESATDFLPNSPNEGWNGTFNGEPADSGTYMYECEVEFDDGVIEIYFGSVGLVK